MIISLFFCYYIL